MTNLNLLKDSEKKVFYHYLIPSICSTLVTSIYILVDTLIIGQGVGSDGISALNIFLPFFSPELSILKRKQKSNCFTFLFSVLREVDSVLLTNTE